MILSSALHVYTKLAFVRVVLIHRFVWQLGGINAVLSFTPKILQESGAEVVLSRMGIGSDSASILASGATSLVSIPFIIMSMRLMDKAGRR